jgi:serine phosphatase RsbU (regulator of sigma subunit)
VPNDGARDGVVEAQNQRKAFFGFERGREFSTYSAQAIVQAAVSFGQSDDITVVAIARDRAVAA